MFIDEFDDFKNHLFILGGIGSVILTIVVANVIFLDLRIGKDNLIATLHTPLSTPTPIVNPSLLVPSILPSSTISPTIPITQRVLIPDAYVPLGTGTVSSRDWTNVPGAIISINLGQYVPYKLIQFEVSMYVPTANEIVWVRLYNVTDQVVVDGSQMQMNSNVDAYLVSSPLHFPSGEKEYQVQMQTQLASPANLTSARLHIRYQ